MAKYISDNQREKNERVKECASINRANYTKASSMIIKELEPV